MMKNINNNAYNKEDGKILIDIARKTIEDRLNSQTTKSDEEIINEKFLVKRGTFVTLKSNGELRGCIGNIEPSESLIEGVRHNAINAAFNDHRFASVTDNELSEIDIEISILTEPKLLVFKDYKELISILRPNIDGVIIRKGNAGATFLPQVWEQLPTTEIFLSHLCNKAGLISNAWKEPEMEVYIYQVQYFEESSYKSSDN